MLQNKYPASPLTVFDSFLKHRELIVQLAKREVIGRYRGSVMGVLWSLVHPLLMLGVYMFVFHVVLEAPENTHADTSAEFAAKLFAGLIVYWVFAECVTRAPGLVVNNVNYVKKVVFPLEILPWVSLASALFHAGVSVGVLLLFYGVIHLSLHWTVVLFPALLLPLTLFALGASWFLASIAVFVRDVGQVIGILTSLMLFLSPVFYPMSAIPESYRAFLYLNPLTLVVEQARNVLVDGEPPSWQGLGIYFMCSVLVAWLGLCWFQKTREGFADAL